MSMWMPWWKEVESNVTSIDPITIRQVWYRACYGHSLAKRWSWAEEWRTEECIDSIDGQETQLAILGMVVQALYTVQGIRNVLHYDAMRKTLEMYGSCYGRYWNTMEYRLELDGREWKLVELASYRTVLGLVNPYFYPCHYAWPHDLWCRRWMMSSRV